MKAKKPTRPRQVKKPPAAASATPTDAQILALFKKAETAWKLSRRQLDVALGTIADAARVARNKPSTQRGSDYASRIEAEIALVRNAVENDNAADAAVFAIRLTETWLRFGAVATSSRSSSPHRSR